MAEAGALLTGRGSARAADRRLARAFRRRRAEEIVWEKEPAGQPRPSYVRAAE
jgi:hypothetical protein